MVVFFLYHIYEFQGEQEDLKQKLFLYSEKFVSKQTLSGPVLLFGFIAEACISLGACACDGNAATDHIFDNIIKIL